MLILPSKSVNIDLGKLIVGFRNQGLKSWVLHTDSKFANKKEFEEALFFIKDKPCIVACGPWFNFVQDSLKFETAVLVDPVIDVKKVNEKIKEENIAKDKVLEKNNEKSEKNNELVPEFKSYNKKLFFYLIHPDTHEAAKLNYPGVIVPYGFLGSEPKGNKESLIANILLGLV